jgi:hypothetical protein
MLVKNIAWFLLLLLKNKLWYYLPPFSRGVIGG